MPTFHPATIAPSSPYSERKVWTAFERLPADWQVFHSVAWQAPRAGRQGDGEADFVLLSPRDGLLVLEVKGGEIVVEDGLWSTIDRSGVRHSIKDPFRQATDSKHTLLRYLRGALSLGDVQVHHAVVFPDVTFTEPIGLNPRELVLDGTDLTDAGHALERLLRHWSPARPKTLSSNAVALIVELLSPTTTVSSVLRTDIAQAERQLVTLTERQVSALSMLRAVRRCVVRGGAGTGKTLLAAEKARRLQLEGARVLLVCFNAPLVSHLESMLKSMPRIQVATFHALCARFGRSTNQVLPREPTPEWYEVHAANVLVNAAETLGDDAKFDALVVDEAQDLSDDWLTALLLLLRSPDSDPVCLFLDSHQQIYRTSLTPPADWPTVQLDINCRNSLPIAKAVAGCFRDPEPIHGADGPSISFIEADDSLLVDAVHDIVRRLLIDEGLTPDQVVVLSNSRGVTNRLGTMLVGPAAFVPLGGIGVVTETIYRYKGLEAEAIVLALNGAPGRPGPTSDSALAYVGLSRARSALFIAGTRQWLQWCKALTAS